MPQRVELWLDNDEAGRNAASLIKKRLCNIEDMSTVYALHNDVNDWLVATNNYA
jgi:DNA primase